MSTVLGNFTRTIEGVSEMHDMYGHVLQPDVQKFDSEQYNALIHSLRLPAALAVYEASRERHFPPQIDPNVQPSTALGKLVLEIESLRDASTTVSFKTGVIQHTCGLMEGFALECLQDFSQLPKVLEPWHFDPAVIILDTDGRPIGLRKAPNAQTTLLVKGLDEQTGALAGAVVRLCDSDGQDITSKAVTSTKHPDIKVVTTIGVAHVDVDRYSTFTVDQDFVRSIDYGGEATQISLDEVAARLHWVAKVAGVV